MGMRIRQWIEGIMTMKICTMRTMTISDIMKRMNNLQEITINGQTPMMIETEITETTTTENTQSPVIETKDIRSPQITETVHQITEIINLRDMELVQQPMIFLMPMKNNKS